MSRSQFWFALFFVLTFVLFNVHGQDVGFGQQCSLSNNCRSDFVCVNGNCECIHAGFQQYNFTIDRCVSWSVFAPCTSIVDGKIVDFPCDLNAECRNDTGFSECLCKPGTRRSGRYCRAEFGQPCERNSDCHNALTCRNERCDCQNLETYDEVSGLCVGLVGAFCGSSHIIICVEGASCDKFDNWDGSCRCTGACVTTADRRCICHNNQGL